MLLSSPSILITDDDLDFRETLRIVFEPRGFRTLLASNGEEALAIVRSEPVHLLLLDMHMPKLTGLETIRRVKEFQLRLPCILISAALDDGLIREAHLAEAFSVLPKPISRRQLNLVVDRALRHAYNWPAETDPAH
jgi:CheY-like chemotaxis protein